MFNPVTSPPSGSVDTFIEYKVVPVTRYHITRYSKSLSPCRTGEMTEGEGSCGKGEYDNFDTAYEVAYALARSDHERMGWPISDERIQYPKPQQPPDIAA